MSFMLLHNNWRGGRECDAWGQVFGDVAEDPDSIARGIFLLSSALYLVQSTYEPLILFDYTVIKEERECKYS